MSETPENIKQDALVETDNIFQKEFPSDIVGLCSGNETADVTDKAKKKSKREKKMIRWLRRREKLVAKRKIRNKQRRTGRQTRRLTIRPAPLEEDIKRNVVLDLSYSDLMSPRDKTRCLSQIVRCYSSNRRSDNSFGLHISSFEGEMRDIAKKNDGFQKWNMKFYEEHYTSIFKKSDIIYLTADSPNVLDKLEDGKVYIIGALVDHNAYKGITWGGAESSEVNHARLPIRESMFAVKTILTINQVFDVLLKVNEGADWVTALKETIPLRVVRSNGMNLIPRLTADEKSGDNDGFNTKPPASFAATNVDNIAAADAGDVATIDANGSSTSDTGGLVVDVDVK